MKHKVKNIHFVGIDAEPCGSTAFHHQGDSRAASEQRT
jgi:hypothetical protein